MILNTSDNLDARIAFKQREARQERTHKWLKEQTANAVFLDDPRTSPTEAAARIGSPLHHAEVERRLKLLNPALTFEWNAFNSSKKMAYLVDARGKQGLFPYEAGLIPERSIMNAIEEFVPDEEVFDNPNFKGERPTPDNPKPHWKRVLVPGLEVKRGWRTMLIKLVISGVITPTQAELSFGSANNPEWQNAMGKAKHALPW